MVADPVGPADSSLLQPELGTAIDYDQNGQADVLLHDVYGGSVNETVLLGRPDGTFEFHDTGIRRPFPLGAAPKPPELTSPGASVHLADLDGDGRLEIILSTFDHGLDVYRVAGSGTNCWPHVLCVRTTLILLRVSPHVCSQRSIISEVQ